MPDRGSLYRRSVCVSAGNCGCAGSPVRDLLSAGTRLRQRLPRHCVQSGGVRGLRRNTGRVRLDLYRAGNVPQWGLLPEREGVREHVPRDSLRPG